MGAKQCQLSSSIWSLIVTWAVLSSRSVRTVGTQDDTITQGTESVCQQLESSPSLEQFVDELTQPPLIDVSGYRRNLLTLGAYKIKQKMHRDLPETTLYGYGTSQETASSPGPTLAAMRCTRSRVRWENHIDDLQHFLPVDNTLDWAAPSKGGVPMVVHLHGAEVASRSDGHPQAWFTASGEKGPTFLSRNYTYPNTQPATLLWYHDHTMGITRLNTAAGLAGMYVIRDPANELEYLPNGEFEKFLLIQDKFIREDGSVNFPTTGNSPSIHPSWCPEYYGDIIFVNGKAWPFLNVLPTLYRFRMVNAANARFFTLTLSHPNVTFTQIGTDGGYLPNPVNRSSLTFGPGERLDFIIDFSPLRPGEFVIVNNSGNALSATTTAVMKFNVVPLVANETIPNVEVPSILGPEVNISTWNETRLRRMTLTEMHDEMGNSIGARLNGLRWSDNVTEVPQLNTTEVWEIINLTDDGHPIHIHLVQFRVKSQQTFDFERYLNRTCTFDAAFPDPTSCYTAEIQPPAEYHEGWKDTVSIFPGRVVSFVIRWATQANRAFNFNATSGPGYTWHCHVVDHEDNEMMRPLQLTASM